MNATSAQNFFSRRSRGEVPLRTVFWRDMLGVGTAVNMLATFVALMAASQASSAWAPALIHFAPLPYNLFLVYAVGRAVPGSRFAVISSFAWLAVMTIL
jgi:hypothetical protein